MFESVLSKLVKQTSLRKERAEGVAFFKAAKNLYQTTSINYLGVNIELVSRPGHFAHCAYSDTVVKHYATEGQVPTDLLRNLDLGEHSDGRPNNAACEGLGIDLKNQQALLLPLLSRMGETALFGVTFDSVPDWEEHKRQTTRELRLLANYFHGHVLRINGHDSRVQILVSARELDCLKWTAAGKTAWEASVILGISERTVRFHLNAAREKLGCATTTQAVAKAITHQLIEL